MGFVQLVISFTFFFFNKSRLCSNGSLFFQVSFNPQDNTQLCVVGNGIFKLFRYSEGNLKQFAFQKMEPQNFLCHTWLSDERVIAGTDTGRLLLFESGELKNEFSVTGSAISLPGTARYSNIHNKFAEANSNNKTVLIKIVALPVRNPDRKFEF